jgi:hypothetical protein
MKKNIETSKTVFVVTSNEKGYGVDAVFSTKELAETFTQLNPSFDITEWDVDEEGLVEPDDCPRCHR